MNRQPVKPGRIRIRLAAALLCAACLFGWLPVFARAAAVKTGRAVWTVELFTLGDGYLVEPVEVEFTQGETAAQCLVRMLTGQGYLSYYSGTPQKAFYLGYLADGDKTAKKYEGYESSRALDGGPENPKKLGVTPDIPGPLRQKLKQAGLPVRDQDAQQAEKGFLGEMMFTRGSGWMYTRNNRAENVSLSDCGLSDGDVFRVQFTLAYGADIGGGHELGNFYESPDKDRLTVLAQQAARAGLKSTGAYQNAVKVLTALDATAARVQRAENELEAALSGDKKTTASSSAPGTGAPPSGVSGASSRTGQAGNSVPWADSRPGGTVFSQPAGASGPGAAGGKTQSAEEGSVGVGPASEESSRAASIAGSAFAKTGGAKDGRQEDFPVWITAAVIAVVLLAGAAFAGWRFVRMKQARRFPIVQKGKPPDPQA